MDSTDPMNSGRFGWFSGQPLCLSFVPLGRRKPHPGGAIIGKQEFGGRTGGYAFRLSPLAPARISCHAVRMDPFLILFLALCALALLATLWRSRKPSPRHDIPFTRRASLLTAGELRFHKVLLR